MPFKALGDNVFGFPGPWQKTVDATIGDRFIGQGNAHLTQRVPWPKGLCKVFRINQRKAFRIGRVGKPGEVRQ